MSSNNIGRSSRRFRGVSTAFFFIALLLALGFASFLLVAPVPPAHAESLGAWTSTTSYPNSVFVQSCATSGGFIYCVGGSNNTANTDGVYFAPISSSGVGAWTRTTNYATAIAGQSCVVSGGYIYCVGGGGTSAAYYAPVSSSGVGAWTATTSYPTLIGVPKCATFTSYIYCVGGIVSGSSSATPDVSYASLSSSGVGTWMSTTPYPTGVSYQSCAVSGGDIYCVGSWPCQDCDPSYVVDFAPVSPSGVGTWNSTTNYANDSEQGIAELSCTSSGGYLYCVGGFSVHSGGEPSNSTYFAPVSSSGAGAWTSTTSYPTSSIYDQSCVTSGGYIYCVGGLAGPTGTTDAVYFAPIASSPSQTSQLTVNAQNSGGQPLTGYYMVLYDSSGDLAGTGFSPAMFTLNSGQPYTIQADDYGSCHFDHWADTGSTAASRSISITSDTQITAVYTCGGSISSVTISSVDQNGNAIFGYYTVLSDSGGNVLGTGFTSKTFATTAGQTYSLQAEGYGNCTFSRWSDGVTSDPRTFTATSGGLAFTAQYDCNGTATSIIEVSTIDGGGAISGYYVTLSQDGVQLQNCFSPCSFIVDDGQTYQVVAASYGGETFAHWSGFLFEMTDIETVNVPPNVSGTIQLQAQYIP